MYSSQDGCFRTLIGIAIGCALALPATAGAIDWNFGAIGITGATEFTADALKATEVSHIVFTGPTTFSEHGFAKVTGVTEGGVVTTPAGLGTDYSLYFGFDITGDLVTSHFTTFDMTLYAVNGVTVFGIDGSNNAFVDNGGNTAIAVATNSLLDGTIGGMPGSDLFAESYSIFSATGPGAAALLAPGLPAVLHGNFFHSASEPGGISFGMDGSVIIQGGDDTMSFSPEPGTWMLLAGGLPGIWWLRRRR